jgi:tetratricopeptide (TPR) repeat protein
MSSTDRARTTSRRLARWAGLAGIVAVILGLRVARENGDRGTTVLEVMPTRMPLPERVVRDSDIAFYERRVLRDPTGAMDLARLARLYLQRSRETGNYADVLRADSAARASLHNRGAHNATAAQILAASLLSQHRFSDALDVEHALVESDPGRIAYRAAYGEIAFELGRYDVAGPTFDSLRSRARDLSIAPRLARWEEIEGHTAAARHLLHVALEEAERRPDLPREQVAWFWLRAGDVELRAGRPDVATHDYAKGLQVHPDDYRILAAVAHLDAVQHDWRGAIRAGERAIGVTLDPATLGVVSDAYAAIGDTSKASEFARAMEVAVSQQPGSYHRAWSLFLLDHGRRVNEVLGKARAELTTRRDVYGWDVMAWALYRNGRIGEAQQAMAHALAEGTQDAMLFYHAGMIERAAGRTAIARRDLEQALAINPVFDPFHPDTARATVRLLAGSAEPR